MSYKPSMLVTAQNGDGTVFVTDFITKQAVNPTQISLLLFFGRAVQHENGHPFALSREQIDSVPTVEFDVSSVDVRSIVRAELNRTRFTS